MKKNEKNVKQKKHEKVNDTYVGLRITKTKAKRLTSEKERERDTA